MTRRVVLKRVLITSITMAIVSAVGAVFFVPAFIDGLQDGPERVAIERLADGYRPKTSYVVLVGRALPVSVEEGPGPDGTTRSYFVPLVASEGGDTVHVVLHDLAEPSLDDLVEQVEFEGILQGAALFDGLAAETRARIAQATKQPLAAELDVLDVEWTPPMRLDMAWGILFASLFAGLIIGLPVAFLVVTKSARGHENSEA